MWVLLIVFGVCLLVVIDLLHRHFCDWLLHCCVGGWLFRVVVLLVLCIDLVGCFVVLFVVCCLFVGFCLCVKCLLFCFGFVVCFVCWFVCWLILLVLFGGFLFWFFVFIYYYFC